MSGGPPDPSAPDQRQQMIRDAIMQVLADPMQWPDETVNWLSGFVTLNVIRSTTGT